MTPSEIDREDNEALLCYTDLVDCCKDTQTKTDGPLGEWYLPSYNKTKVLSRRFTEVGYFKSRGLSVVRLHRNNSGEFPVGVFYCEIPNDKSVSQVIFIGIYDVEDGNLINT